ncbi:MAG: hypothetical protein J5552_04335 [Prevotella sp.]|nr:hypothetical protein [Prevotella sp.]
MLRIFLIVIALISTIIVDAQKVTKVFTPDIQLSYDDYRKYNFSKNAELL